MKKLPANKIENFVVKFYIEGDRPTIKGNGFDGLEIGSTREEAEEFIEFVNQLIEEHNQRGSYENQ